MSKFHKKTTQEEIYDRKSTGRRDIASLSVEEKIERLVMLQKMNSNVARAAGREYKQPWDIKFTNQSKEA
tara:strand:- start:582 stop:791 length:210 start_codon:yes stop_codon:yes gene_type:complete